MELQDGQLYSPEQLSEWEVFGPGVSAEAIRKATRRRVNPLPCTRWPPGSKRGRILLSKANVEAGLTAGLQDEPKRPVEPSRSRDRRMAAVASLPAGGERLTAQPQRARRSRRAS